MATTMLRQIRLLWLPLLLAASTIAQDSRPYDGSAVTVLESYGSFQDSVVKSDQIWMVQFFNSTNVKHQDSLKSLVPGYKDLARIAKGLFQIGAVDVSTPEGQRVASLYSNEAFKKALPTIIILGEDKTKSVESFLDGGFQVQDLLQALANTASNIILQRTGGGSVPKDDYQSSSSSSRSSSSSSSSSSKRKTAYAELSGADYDEKVLNNPQVVLVAFTAPWCGHCQRLHPEFKQAGRALAGEEVLLAWVNAEAERQLGGIYGVQGFPTLKLFAGGAPKSHADATDFNFERSKDGIVAGIMMEVEKSGVAREIPQLTSPSVLQDECQGSNHLCVLAGLPHILDSGADGRNKYRDMLTQVSKTFKGQAAFSFVWFEGGSQPGLEKAFDLTFGYPALIAFSMDRKAFAVLHGSFTEQKITAFLHSITTGRQATIKLDDIPKLETTEPWDGKDGEAIEEEFDLSELFDEGEL